jgi:hypothetical protein
LKPGRAKWPGFLVSGCHQNPYFWRMLLKENIRAFKLAALIFTLLLSACSVEQYVNVPVNYDPKITLPDSTRILIVNQFDASQVKNTNPKKLAVIKAGAYSAIKYAAVQLSKLPKVKITNLADSIAFTLTTDSVKQLAAKYHVKYVLALKKFTADIVLSGVDNGTAFYSTQAEVNFVLYEDNGIFFKKLNARVSDAQSEGSYPGLIGSMVFHPTIKGNKSSVNYSAQHATQDALQEYLPAHIEHNRPLYNDSFFQPAVKEILAKHYSKADALLTPFLKDNSVLTQCKAAYNLAVVYEAEGDIESAIEMAELSNQKYRNLYANAILADLKEE